MDIEVTLPPIEIGVDIPPVGEWRYIRDDTYGFKELTPGTSRLYRSPQYNPKNVACAALVFAKRAGMKFTTRRNSLGVRIWRVS